MTLEAAVEALARAMGLWGSGQFPRMYEAGLAGFVIWTAAPPPRGETPESKLRHELTSHEAMLVLRCALLGTTRVRCPGCEGAKWERRRDLLGDLELWARPGEVGLPDADVPSEFRGWAPESGPLEFGFHRFWSRPCPTCPPAVECEGCSGEGAQHWCAGKWWPGHESMANHRDCPACDAKGTIPGKPTGHVDRPWAEVLIGAMPRECDACLGRVVVGRYDDGEAVECGRCDDGSTPGDPESRAMLSVKADELQANGDPLGLWLALWLGQHPCGCANGRERKPPQDARLQSQMPPCTRCAGSDLALGAHDRAMAEAGERLAEQLGAAAVGRA